ncbi:hypothetical protein PHLGIDRAFT_225166 [Phlebiopsis gigantea 11061_1 CR5-6]|uniref:Uncharacterized protein n=1 Tax=Phlebiopsis gigantea (strain 11061_1 CR5-6) TaxID=745531 RepID=A0A0C3PEB4_PHLG1|nr:hypothetical protein PHLGIDRAFT_225166 [Phlebiopsis gigantea 11061_1 CR5-6]
MVSCRPVDVFQTGIACLRHQMESSEIYTGDMYMEYNASAWVCSLLLCVSEFHLYHAFLECHIAWIGSYSHDSHHHPSLSCPAECQLRSKCSHPADFCPKCSLARHLAKLSGTL